ncbi:DMT family transporter [Marichromatium bheemlicum]|uniref:EamA family transporter n=1 Tax=Marichromatium bheemlicum TaxID=365339 RepID=A0ABX1I4K3_9GAMM|nr:EamA family transporter [Marichromatium bheemlicum]NKN32488.1 EamA family transporter [Marichromatium bheemlicum]
MWMILVAAALWGMLGLFAVTLNGAGFDGQQVALLRVLGAALCIVFGARWLLCGLDGRSLISQAPWLLLHAMIGVLGYNLCYFQAIDVVGVAMAVVLLYTAPLWALVLGVVLDGESVTGRGLAAALAAVCGVGLLLGQGVSTAGGSMEGVIFGLAAGVCYALYPVLGRRLVVQLGPDPVMASGFLLSALVLLLLPETWEVLAGLAVHRGEGRIWGALLAMTLLGTLLAYALFTRGLQRVTASRAAVLATVEPVVGVLGAVLWVGEGLLPLQWGGLALILVGALLVAIPGPGLDQVSGSSPADPSPDRPLPRG